jgi:hypothetical protein
MLNCLFDEFPKDTFFCLFPLTIWLRISCDSFQKDKKIQDEKTQDLCDPSPLVGCKKRQKAAAAGSEFLVVMVVIVIMVVVQYVSW